MFEILSVALAFIMQKGSGMLEVTMAESFDLGKPCIDTLVINSVKSLLENY